MNNTIAKALRPLCLLALPLVLATPGHAADNAAASAQGQVIDLPTTLRLAGANNINLAIVRQALVQAQAANEAATFAMLPWLSAGVGTSSHHGAVQDVGGNVFDADKHLNATAAGIQAQVNLGDAIFQKLAASQLESFAEYSLNAAHDQTIVDAANAYFALVNAVANVSITQDAARISGEYEDQLTRAVGIGMANKSDALRVSVQTQNYGVFVRRAQENARSAAATLATVLHLNPAINLRPMDPVAPQLEMIRPDTDLNALLQEALDKRPEVRASAASVKAADWQAKQSIYGPLIPSVGAQAMHGNLSGAPRGLPDRSFDSQDYALMLSWRVGPGGLLDFSRIEGAKSRLEQGRLTDQKLHDDISQQVVQGLERLRSAFDQVGLTKKSVDLAEQSLQLSQSRKDFGVASVLEVIQAQKDLVDARSSYVSALSGYAQSQYAMARAVGRIAQ